MEVEVVTQGDGFHGDETSVVERDAIPSGRIIILRKTVYKETSIYKGG